MIIARIPGHEVAAETVRLENGTLYTSTSCSCDRRGPVDGSADTGAAWANEHLGAVQENRARREAMSDRRR